MDEVDHYGNSREIEYQLNLAGWKTSAIFCELDADLCGWIVRAVKGDRALTVKEGDRTFAFERLEKKIARLRI